MDGKVVFSNDGVLRFISYAATSTTAVPLQLIQEAQSLDPYPFFLQQTRKPFILEEGSTVGTFLLCLAPWAKVVSDLTDRNVQSYIDELRKPSTEEPAFDRVEVRQQVGFSREMHYEPMPDGVDFSEWLNRDRGDTVWLDTYEINGEYNISGYSAGDASNYSVSTNIHSLKNVPLIVNRTPIVVYYERTDQGTPLINRAAPGVVAHNREELRASTILTLKGATDEDMTVLELLKVVIEHGLWFNTPQGAISERAMLKELVAQLPVVEDEIEDVEVADDDSVQKPMTIEIAPGAFSGVVSHYQHEQNEWRELMATIGNSPALPIRIGSIKEATPIDDRAVGMIFE